ncbi:MAG: sigma 54-dependent Fis family transcriptional regulator [Fibrobacteres bacterium]|nr:sigma 54-dependent Fis family transcriptional regulator [Fibrobacterota bacterium]
MTEIVYPCLRSPDGTHHPLGRRLATLGSDPDCQVRLPDPSVRPQHAFLVFQMGAWRLRKLEAVAALKVDGIDVADEIELHHGAMVQAGRLELLFLEKAQENRPEAPAMDLAPLPVLLAAVADILRETDSVRVLVDMVQASARLLSCDGVRVLHRPVGEGLWRTLASCPAGAPSSRFSSSALARAESAGEAVLLGENDLARLGAGESVQLNGIRSILCAPLSLPDGEEGFLYADRLAAHRPFEESDRGLFEALRKLYSEIAAIAVRHERQRKTIRTLQDDAGRKAGATSILHESAIMSGILKETARVSVSDVPVHIHGETGTGKELLARFVHDSSRRADNPFIAINCGAIPENLMESELFGHEKGAFTGAGARKEGWIEKAQGGTLFLDELGELPLSLQVKLLRVLQQGELVRVGGSEPIKVDFRLVTATNRNLKEEVAAGRFRADLYYRVAVVPLTLPPLRERSRDAVLLAGHFCRRFCLQYGLDDKSLSRAAEKAIVAHPWPGNVRELENAIQKAVILGESDRIQPRDLGFAQEDDAMDELAESSAATSLYAIRDRAEAEAIRQALEKARGNVSLVSRMLDVDRKVLIRTMERLEILPESFK